MLFSVGAPKKLGKDGEDVEAHRLNLTLRLGGFMRKIQIEQPLGQRHVDCSLVQIPHRRIRLDEGHQQFLAACLEWLHNQQVELRGLAIDASDLADRLA